MQRSCDIFRKQNEVPSGPMPIQWGGNSQLTHRAHRVFLSCINTCPRGRKFNELLVFFWLPITFPLCVAALVHANKTPDVNLHFSFTNYYGRLQCPVWQNGETKVWVSINVMPTPATTSIWINPIKPSLISWIAFWELITAVVEF